MRSRGHEVPYDARDVFDGLRERGRRGGGFGLSVWCLSFSDSLSVPTSFRHGMETRAVLGFGAILLSSRELKQETGLVSKSWQVRWH
ncbi:Os07g0523982 [Oryza sativa Japonica Group]|uniref:Os07g0523982 protein n=1 Tax=Oryza sativa subsp. japonica TaxID=39947 RepID=A0A0P0X774_ORYSJ|nr:Os07g0523982 [Oryza sativa Japonica Group]